MEGYLMIKKGLCIVLFCLSPMIKSVSYEWTPEITEVELKITPHCWETCYQYAERKVSEMKQKYSERRIVGSDWLSSYWAHHYEGGLVYRNYFWKPA